MVSTSKTYAQSDQSLCRSLGYSVNIKLLTEQHLEHVSMTSKYRGKSQCCFMGTPLGEHQFNIVAPTKRQSLTLVLRVREDCSSIKLILCALFTEDYLSLQRKHTILVKVIS